MQMSSTREKSELSAIIDASEIPTLLIFSPPTCLCCRPWNPTTPRVLCPPHLWLPDTKGLLLQLEYFVSKRKLLSHRVWNVLRHIFSFPSLQSNNITSQESKGKASSYMVSWHRCALKNYFLLIYFIHILRARSSFEKSRVTFLTQIGQ